MKRYIVRTLANPGVQDMEYKVLITVFSAVFIAELGDKTQLATMLFAADKEVSKWTVFFGASLALIVASGIGVLAGSAISQYVSEKATRLRGRHRLHRHRRVDSRQGLMRHPASTLESIRRVLMPLRRGLFDRATSLLALH